MAQDVLILIHIVQKLDTYIYIYYMYNIYIYYNVEWSILCHTCTSELHSGSLNPKTLNSKAYNPKTLNAKAQDLWIPEAAGHRLAGSYGARVSGQAYELLV